MSTENDCPVGSYSEGGRAACVLCPAGYACPSKFSSVKLGCPAGTYSEAGAALCTDCEAGKECPLTNQTGVDCSSGYFSLGNQMKCTPCPAGFKCPVNNQAPTMCPEGTYNNLTAQSDCQTCSEGYACAEGSKSATPAAGKCPMGYFCTDGLTVSPCPKGKYGNASGAVSEATGCAPCPQGYYCLEGTVGLPKANFMCPRGYYCPESTGDYKQYPCAAGKYSPILRAVADTECLDCPAGRYCAAGTSDPNGVSCARGHYCVRGTPKMTPCPGGTFTEEEGATGQEYCKECPAGYTCSSGSDSPLPCEPGTFNPMTGQNETSSCAPCTAGQSCTKAGLVKPNYPCSPGYYCPGGNYKPNQTEHACPAGTFSDYNNLTAVEQCEKCPPTVACLIGTGGLQKPPVACSAGHYCPAGTRLADQYPCPAGSYSNQTNLEKVEECSPCPRGYFCLEGSSQPSDVCPTGHWCPEGKLLFHRS